MLPSTAQDQSIAGPSWNTRHSSSARSSTSMASLDEEKWISSPLPSVSAARSYFSLRKRRVLSMAGGVLALMVLSGWYTVGFPEMGELWDGTGDALQYTSSDSTMEAVTELEHEYKPNNVPVLPSVNIKTWGLQSDSSELLSGLIPWPTRARYSEVDEPLSTLGRKADEVYNLGYWELPEAAAQLDVFISTCFPDKLHGQLKYGIARYLAGVGERDAWDKNKMIWQTDRDRGKESSADVATWRNGRAQKDDWEWEMVAENEADAWVEKHFAGSRIHQMWTMLPSGILRSDTLRYLLLLVNGGIYTDTDTRLRKAPSRWGQGATLWADGKGLPKEARGRILAGEAWEEVLGPPTVVVGIEADVGEREDWNEWWPRPIQVVQWTIASAPSHPIILSSILRIIHSTAKAVDWTHAHSDRLDKLRQAGKSSSKAYKELEKVNVLDEPGMGGPVGVMDWTGPGLFTDAVLGYLNVRYGLVWTDLKDLSTPLRVGDVVILPVTGFSPGVGNFGSKAPSHPQAMVEHKFAGSWRKPAKDKRSKSIGSNSTVTTSHE